MVKPNRKDYEYSTGELKRPDYWEDALSKYIEYLESEINSLKNMESSSRIIQADERKRLLEAFTNYCKSRDIEPKRFHWENIVESFLSL